MVISGFQDSMLIGNQLQINKFLLWCGTDCVGPSKTERIDTRPSELSWVLLGPLDLFSDNSNIPFIGLDLRVHFVDTICSRYLALFKGQHDLYNA